MEPASATSRVMVLLTTLLLSYAANLAPFFIAASELPSIQLEKEALVNSRWWGNSSTNNSFDHCNWNGVTCNSAGSITKIHLSHMKINGELGQLKFSCFHNLESLSLSSNNFTGSIPSQIDDLPKLEHLYLDENNLTGCIPREIGSLRNLKELNLSGNHLSKPIPPALGRLTNLTILDLSNNSLNGTIPDSLPVVVFLDLSYNDLEGEIPNRMLCYYPRQQFTGNKDLNLSTLCSTRIISTAHDLEGKHKKIVIPFSIIFLLIIAYLIFTFFYFQKRNNDKNDIDSKKEDPSVLNMKI